MLDLSHEHVFPPGILQIGNPLQAQVMQGADSACLPDPLMKVVRLVFGSSFSRQQGRVAALVAGRGQQAACSSTSASLDYPHKPTLQPGMAATRMSASLPKAASSTPSTEEPGCASQQLV